MKNAKKLISSLVLAGLMCLSMAACAPAGPDPTPDSPTVQAQAFTPVDTKVVVGGYEWGPAVEGVLFKAEGKIAPNALSADMFTVKTGNANLQVLDAYTATADGIKTDAASEYFVVKFKATSSLFGTFSYIGGKNIWNANGSANITVTMNEDKTLPVIGTEQITEYATFTRTGAIGYSDRVIPSTATLNKGSYTKDSKTLTYAAYETDAMKNDAGDNALVIWLHGAGEGGTDVDIALLGNDVTNLMEPEIQSYFVEDGLQGAYVLVVQTPTMWMDNGNGQNHSGSDISVYTAVLMETIQTYVAANGDIDTDRIYIGGCSNGGYMTMNMLINHGDYFAAAYPICEAYTNSYVTDAQINYLAQMNIWFTHSANDTTVNPGNYTNATYVRLLQAGADNVYYSYFQNIVGVDDPNANQSWGSGGNYMGHFSWIYTLSNRCKKVQSTEITAASGLVASNDGGANTVGNYDGLWDWMAAQRKPTLTPRST